MIGIYRIINKISGKTYVGQSNNIERRFVEHKYKTGTAIDNAIQKYGADNFSFEVLEECTLEELNEKEKFWIAYYNTYSGFGYNLTAGGDKNCGEENGRAKLSQEDVEYIRDCYNSHMRRKEVYQRFKDKISFSTFSHIWDGSAWSHIKPEVYTEANKKFYSRQSSLGEKSSSALLTDAEVIKCRQRYVQETAKEIYQDYKKRLSYQTFQQILWGRHYSYLPVYNKKKKIWIIPEGCNDYLHEGEY